MDAGYEILRAKSTGLIIQNSTSKIQNYSITQAGFF